MTAIALVCDYSLRYLGGAQAAFLDQARILAAHGHEVTIVAPDAAEHAGAPDAVTIPSRWSLPSLDLPVIRNTARLRARLREEFTARGVQVVHLHSEFGLTAAAIQVADDMGIPVVQTVHTFFWQAPVNRLFSAVAARGVRGYARWLRGFAASRARLAERRLDSALRGITLSTAQRVQGVISPSAHQADRLRDAGAGNVVVIANAVPDDGQEGVPLQSAEQPLRIVWVGRLVPEKRILEFVDAVRRAQDSLGPGMLEVEVIGEGPLRADAEAAAGTAPIRFLGRVERDRVRAHMRGGHLVALTSLGFDNQPVVVVEAFREARSVLYVDPALKEGLAEGGILAKAPDAAGIATAIVELAGDPARILDASRRAQEAAGVFAPERHARLVAEVYARAQEALLTRGDSRQDGV